MGLSSKYNKNFYIWISADLLLDILFATTLFHCDWTTTTSESSLASLLLLETKQRNLKHEQEETLLVTPRPYWMYDDVEDERGAVR